ncbi:hypothetical protein SARC_12445, partial [Sphaeroforma arctica JP610]
MIAFKQAAITAMRSRGFVSATACVHNCSPALTFRVNTSRLSLPGNNRDIPAHPISLRTFGTKPNTDGKAHACEWPSCGYACAFPSTLRIHMRVHTDERPYPCEYPGCGKRFKISGDLTIHTRVHTGERPYACEYPGCGKRFTTSRNLTTHTRVHTGERPYPCEYPGCGKKFATSGGRK